MPNYSYCCGDNAVLLRGLAQKLFFTVANIDLSCSFKFMIGVFGERDRPDGGCIWTNGGDGPDTLDRYWRAQWVTKLIGKTMANWSNADVMGAAEKMQLRDNFKPRIVKGLLENSIDGEFLANVKVA